MASYYRDKFDLTSKPATTHLFLAEGQSEAGFIDAHLKTLQPDYNTTTVLCFKGLGNIRDKTDTLVKLLEKGPTGLDQLRGIGVMGDAETNPAGQLDVAIQIATSLGFSHPAKDIRETQNCEQNGRRFCVALAPAHDKSGRIEDLVIQEVSAKPIFKCLENSFNCIEKASNSPLDTKARVQMFISAAANNSLAGVGRAFLANVLDTAAPPYANARGMIEYVLAAT